jgi:hypothetical protein
MICFVHADSPAVAICKHCAKGLCAACAVVGAGGASCRGACEERVALYEALVRRSKSTFSALAPMFWALTAICALLGLGAIAGAGWEVARGAPATAQMQVALVGVVALALAVVSSFLALRFGRQRS